MRRLNIDFVLAAVLMAIVGISATARAADLTLIQVPSFSKHYDGEFREIEGLNEDNPGLIVNFKARKSDKFEFKIGTYKNAFKKQSFIFGVEKGYKIGPARVGGFGVLATNYDNPAIFGGFVESPAYFFGIRADMSYNPNFDAATVGFSVFKRF